MTPILFLRTAWMIHYKGVTAEDIPNGAGSYVSQNHDGGEVANFYPMGGKYYGYARIRKGDSLRIERLGAPKEAPFLNNITVVFFATDPTLGGQYVVGWFDRAKLFRKVQDLPADSRKGHPFFMVETPLKNGKLLPVELRKFEIPDDGPGQTNAWYVQNYNRADTYLKEFEKFKANPVAYRKTKPRPRNKSGWQLDAEKRKATEIAAMDAAERYFSEKGFTVTYVHRENLGWDIEAVKGKQSLRLEVKGSCNPLESVLLTPNEYLNSGAHKNYRVCILENALDLKAQLHICQLHSNKKSWVSHTGKSLKVIEIKSAKLQLIP